jgi:hypothetical protein
MMAVPPVSLQMHCIVFPWISISNLLCSACENSNGLLWEQTVNLSIYTICQIMYKLLMSINNEDPEVWLIYLSILRTNSVFQSQFLHIWLLLAINTLR